MDDSSTKMSVVRKSKFRHVYGKALKKDQCFDNIRVTKSSTDRPLCAVNPKYIAIITDAAGGSALLVLPLSKVGRVDRDVPTVSGHKGAVLDIAWCPHNDNVLASGSEDSFVKVWMIPEGGVVTEHLTESVCTLRKHQKKVLLVQWHPTAENILASAGADNLILLWNAGTEELFVEVVMPDLPLSLSFNYNGSKFVTTCKDKKIRVIEARTGVILQEGDGHTGAKPAQAVYLKDGKVFTTGFSKRSDRQYALWDENNLDKCLTMEDIDSSNGVLIPIYDYDTNMLYLCGKGDSVIRYFEVTDEEPFVHFLNVYQANNPQRGICCMPKRGVNVNICEIVRFYKLHNSGLCEVIPMYVPRKSELFQEDLYPDTAGSTAAISADKWFDKKNSDPEPEPILISMRDNFVGNTEVSTAKVAARKSNVVDKLAAKTPVVNKLAAKSSTEDKLAAVTPQKRPEPVQQVETPKPVVQEERAPPAPKPSAHAPVSTPAKPSREPERKSVEVSQENSAMPPSEETMETNVEGTDEVDSVALVTSKPPDYEELMETVNTLREKVEANEQEIVLLRQRVAVLESEKQNQCEKEGDDDI